MLIPPRYTVCIPGCSLDWSLVVCTILTAISLNLYSLKRLSQLSNSNGVSPTKGFLDPPPNTPSKATSFRCSYILSIPSLLLDWIPLHQTQVRSDTLLLHSTSACTHLKHVMMRIFVPVCQESMGGYHKRSWKELHLHRLELKALVRLRLLNISFINWESFFKKGTVLYLFCACLILAMPCHH